MTKRSKPDIREFKWLKAAAGGSGASGGGTGFYAGQNMVCKILHAQSSGYEVLVPKYNVVGLLVTEQRFTPDEEVPVQYVCMSPTSDRMLLQCRFGAPTSLDVSTET